MVAAVRSYRYDDDDDDDHNDDDHKRYWWPRLDRYWKVGWGCLGGLWWGQGSVLPCASPHSPPPSSSLFSPSPSPRFQYPSFPFLSSPSRHPSHPQQFLFFEPESISFVLVCMFLGATQFTLPMAKRQLHLARFDPSNYWRFAYWGWIYPAKHRWPSAIRLPALYCLCWLLYLTSTSMTSTWKWFSRNRISFEFGLLSKEVVRPWKNTDLYVE